MCSKNVNSDLACLGIFLWQLCAALPSGLRQPVACLQAPEGGHQLLHLLSAEFQQDLSSHFLSVSPLGSHFMSLHLNIILCKTTLLRPRAQTASGRAQGMELFLFLQMKILLRVSISKCPLT